MAYFKAVTLGEAPMVGQSQVIEPPGPELTLAGRLLKLVSEEHRVSGDVVGLASQFNTTQEAVREAVEKLEEEGFIKIELEGLKPFLVPA